MDKLSTLKMLAQLNDMGYKNRTRANVHVFYMGFEKCDPSENNGLTRRPVLRFREMKHRKLTGPGKAVRVDGQVMRYFLPEELPGLCFTHVVCGKTLTHPHFRNKYGAGKRISDYVNVAVIEDIDNESFLASA